MVGLDTIYKKPSIIPVFFTSVTREAYMFGAYVRPNVMLYVFPRQESTRVSGVADCYEVSPTASCSDILALPSLQLQHHGTIPHMIKDRTKIRARGFGASESGGEIVCTIVVQQVLFAERRRSTKQRAEPAYIERFAKSHASALLIRLRPMKDNKHRLP